MAEAGFDAPAQLPDEAGIPDAIIKHEMNGDDTAAEIVAEDPLSSTLNENGEGVRDGLEFLYEDDSSEDEATVTIGAIQKNVPFQKGSMVSKDKIDMDGQPTINGTMIYDLDLATMEDKPWQKPGADITDYFNYGFNEETWNSYCERQRKLRAEYGGNQKEVNRAITSSININFNPQQSQQQPILNVMNQGGRQLINLAGPEKPTKANKVFDLTKPPPSMAEPVSPQIQVLGSNRNVSEGNEESSSPTSTVPVFNAFVPPPNFNPNVPPPGLSRGSTLPSVNLNIPPPAFNQQAPIYAFAGFNNNQPPPQQQFNSHNSSGPQPLLGTDFSSASFEKHDSRERTQGDSSENSGDDHNRRRRRRRSGSPRRRKEEKPRDYRDKSSSSRSRRREDHREKRRDRDDDYEKDRKRRKHDRSERTSSSSKTYKREESPEAPPGFD